MSVTRKGNKQKKKLLYFTLESGHKVCSPSCPAIWEGGACFVFYEVESCCVFQDSLESFFLQPPGIEQGPQAS